MFSNNLLPLQTTTARKKLFTFYDNEINYYFKLFERVLKMYFYNGDYT